MNLHKLIAFAFIILFHTPDPIFCQEKSSINPVLPNLLQQFPNLRDFTLSETGREAYFTAQSPLGELSVIMKIEKKADSWSNPQLVTFSGMFMDLEPFLTWDGLKLFFASNRPVDQNSDETKDFDIWYVERETPEYEWSNPINLGGPVNSIHNEFYPSIATNGNLYFTSDPPDSKGKDDIYLSIWEKDHYSKPVSMSDSINSEGYEFNAFIAPDESYILFSGYNREDGYGSGDFYISYQLKDQGWSKAKNLGKVINSKQMDYCPFVHLASNTFYFTSRRSGLKPNPHGYTSTSAFLEIVNGYENGLSRLYQVNFDQLSTQTKLLHLSD